MDSNDNLLALTAMQTLPWKDKVKRCDAPQDTCVATTATTSMATPSMTGHTSTSIHTIRALSLTPSIVAIWRILIHIWALRSAPWLPLLHGPA